MPPVYRRPLCYAAACALALAAATTVSPVRADPAPSFSDLLARIGQSPSALEAEALLDAAEARVRQAGVRPNPTLELAAESAFGTGPFSGYGNAETTLSVTQDLELWGRRGARVNTARAEAGTAELQRDLALLDTAGRLALIYAEAEAAQRRFVLAEEALALVLADARAMLRLVEEGREPLMRGLQAESETTSARAARDEALAERDAGFARLTAVAMLDAPATAIPDSLLDRGLVGGGSSTGAVPTVRIAEAEKETAERRIKVERIRSRPDVSATVGVRRYEAEDATALTVGISLPLPLFDRNRGNIDAAEAEFRAADARLTQTRQEAQADQQAATARLLASTSRVSAADAGVASAEEAYRLMRIGFEAGRLSQLELGATRAALVHARNAAVDARLARVRAEIDMARLQGRAPFGGVQ
ncbi:Nickel and cobalt resistance protein CnrC precursor [compost metagenome]